MIEFVEKRRDVFHRQLRERERLLRNRNRLAQKRRLFDEFGIALHVRRRWQILVQRRQIMDAALFFEQFHVCHVHVERRQVDGLAVVVQFQHGGEDFFVHGIVKIVGHDAVGGNIERIVVE